MAPISALPNELMERIFTIYAVDTDTLSNLKWTKIMFVCRRWCELAEGAHRLWASIDLKYDGTPLRLYTQLKRSGFAPLTLRLIWCDEYYTDIILENSERICELDLSGIAKHVYDVINRLSDHSFPALSSLSLDPSYKQDERFIQALPDVLFDGRLPGLRELTLTLIDFPWASLNGLHTLPLTYCNDSAASLPPTFSGLLEMLSSCPQLYILKLDDIPSSEIHQDYRTVDLPDLASLRLRDDVGTCMTLLIHLRIPPTTRLQILPFGVCSGADVRDILIDHGPSHCTMSIFCDTEHHSFLDRGAAQCPLSLNCHPRSKPVLRKIMTKVINAIPSESITHLDARGASSLCEVAWKNTLQLLPTVETIYLHVYTGTVNCVDALNAIERFFPRIRHIYFCIIRELGEDKVVAFMTLLAAYLEMRFTNGRPLQRLEIDDPSHFLSGDEQKTRMERIFPLVDGQIVRNGVVYDPVRLKELRAEWELEWPALAAKFGIDIAD
ncbi:F-box domain-containing protein [Mycena venus]|uniref:F-box domain-containing protein n=1 Tax=Mycena venus TaxID=2733690 RepID=A0A8H6YVF5_9AGAR|nr:F-box domain-containing protein [Mycena venus]